MKRKIKLKLLSIININASHFLFLMAYILTVKGFDNLNSNGLIFY